MTTAIIGGIIGGIAGYFACTATQTDTAQRIKCRLTGHDWTEYGRIQHECPKHGTEHANIDICARCGTKKIYKTDPHLRTTPEE